MVGFIQLHRKILEWEWYDDHNTTRLFIHMLMRANHKDNKWRGILVGKGSFISGRKVLAHETGLSEQQIRTSLNRLKSTNEITIKTTNSYSMYAIVSWESFQGKQPTNQPTTNQRLTTNNNDNNDNNIIKDIPPNPLDDEFEFLWSEYKPYEMAKGNKKTALQKYKLARKKISYEKIIGGVTRYIKYCHASECKTKHVGTWINQNGWEDDYPIANKKTSYFDSLANASRAVQNSMEKDFNEW